LEKGLNGEAKVVKNISANLDDKYSLFNDIILVDVEGKRRGNIDHIIVGPMEFLL
jgi:Nuclease-related domain